MALMLTSASVRERSLVSAIQASSLTPLVTAAGSTVASAALLDQLQPGRNKTIITCGAAVAGGAVALRSSGRFMPAVGAGTLMGAVWTLFKRGGEGRSLFPFIFKA